jgi:azurin
MVIVRQAGAAPEIYVQGRDQITRLHDLNGDGEADFYECFSQAFETSPAGHDFICGLERDEQGNFYTASGNQGLLRISADGRSATVLATGFRNPDGLGLNAAGIATIPCSEGDWTPASMIAAVRVPAAESAEIPYFGYPGLRGEQPPALPLVYLPRGLDNSAGGQVAVTGENWRSLRGRGNMVHFSFGQGSALLLMLDEVGGQLQGGVLPLQTEFLSGAHRGRFHPGDGGLYVSGMAGWGNYNPDDGCLQRVRYIPQPDWPLPVGFHVHENGVLVELSQPLPMSGGINPSAFAQCWNYRYSGAYGSPELSPSHPGTPGHDVLEVAGVHVVHGGAAVFVELPELQPVNQLHLLLDLGGARPSELFCTVHQLDRPFADFPGYQPRAKTIAPHPILADVALALRSIPNPWLKRNSQARKITIAAGSNLQFETTSIRVRSGEPLAITFRNPDVVPHNFALVQPGALQKVGEASNRLIADPEAVLQHYVPDLPEVIAYTDITPPGGEFTIWIDAPKQPGRYPYLCTFPGHWMVMNGELLVE